MGELDCNIKVLQFSSPSPQSPPARGGEVTIECTNIFVVHPRPFLVLTVRQEWIKFATVNQEVEDDYR